MYDFAIVGAGINGTFMAHFLSKSGKKVLLLDKDGIASGGSGAAGAFLAPKIGKSGPLQQLINTAYNFSIDFYSEHFPHLLTQHGLLHLPKNAIEADHDFISYKNDSSVSATPIPKECIELSEIPEIAIKGIFYPSSAIIEPDTLCKELAIGSEFIKEQVSKIEFVNNHWKLNDKYQAVQLVLASGWEDFPLYERYMNLRPIWGERIEVVSKTFVPCNYHEKISISTTKKNGQIVIGATHEQNTTRKPFSEDAVQTLLHQAEKILKLEGMQVVDHRGGVRSGTIDYFPVIGPLVDVEQTLKKFPNLINGAKVDPKLLTYHPNVSIINGAGGRGFVLAPYLAQQLTAYLLEKSEPNPAILPSRLFVRWAKKEPSLKIKDR